jgi:methylmalonyl-CoA mutase N-terminal domain/subunit
VERLKRFKAERDQGIADRRLAELKAACEGSENLMPFLRAALRDNCSVGEVCGSMREVFGSYQPES